MRVVALCVALCLGVVSALPLEESAATNREGKGFVGFSLFPPPARVEPVECIASNNLLSIGTCYNQQACQDAGGVASGKCSTGGVCCVVPSVCGGTIARNRTWFVNKDFPKKSRDAGDCLITIKKFASRVKQVRLDFSSLQLEKPRLGRCLSDALMVRRRSKGRSEELEVTPQLCGDNSGQHVYVDVGEDESEVKVQVRLQPTLGRSNTDREWRILVTQHDDSDKAPEGCLQYYSQKSASVRSLNYDDNFADKLNYDICFNKLDRAKVADDICTRKVTNLELLQPSGTFRRLDLSRVRRSSKSRELADRAPPAQSTTDGQGDVSEAFSDVISLVSKTVEELRSEADKKSGSNAGIKDTNSLPFLLAQLTADAQDATTLKIESSDQSPTPAQADEGAAVATESAPEVLPILYSEGNEGVISQIQQVVQQLQQEQLGVAAMTVNRDADSVILTAEEPQPEAPQADEAGVKQPEKNQAQAETQDSLENTPKLVGETLDTNGIVSTTSSPEPVTDNLAVEGFLSETVLTPSGSPVRSPQFGVQDDRADQESSPLANGMLGFGGDASSVDVMLEMMKDQFLSEYLGDDGPAGEEDLDQDPVDAQESSSSSATNEGKTSGTNEGKTSGSTQAEITVLDPEAVQHHGDLVLIDRSGGDAEGEEAMARTEPADETSTTSVTEPPEPAAEAATEATSAVAADGSTADSSTSSAPSTTTTTSTAPPASSASTPATTTTPETTTSTTTPATTSTTTTTTTPETTTTSTTTPATTTSSTPATTTTSTTTPATTTSTTTPTTTTTSTTTTTPSTTPATTTTSSTTPATTTTSTTTTSTTTTPATTTTASTTPATTTTSSTTPATTTTSTTTTTPATTTSSTTTTPATTTTSTTTTPATTTTSTTTPATTTTSSTTPATTTTSSTTPATTTTSTTTTPSTTPATTTTSTTTPATTTTPSTTPATTTTSTTTPATTTTSSTTPVTTTTSTTTTTPATTTTPTTTTTTSTTTTTTTTTSTTPPTTTIPTTPTAPQAEESSEGQVEWLILSDDDPAPSDVVAALPVPPEVVITSGIGFGSNDKDKNDVSLGTRVGDSASDLSSDDVAGVVEVVMPTDEGVAVGSGDDAMGGDGGDDEKVVSVVEVIMPGTGSSSQVSAGEEGSDVAGTMTSAGGSGVENTLKDATEMEDEIAMDADSVASVVEVIMPANGDGENDADDEKNDVMGVMEVIMPTDGDKAPTDVKPADLDDGPAAEGVEATTESDIEGGPSTIAVEVENNNEAAAAEDEIIDMTPEEECGGAFLRVRENIICGSRLRGESVFNEDKNYEDERFRDVERVSIRTMDSASRRLRFSFDYETNCPVSKTTTTPAPVRKTVTLLQYLLGWYR
ncbi:mucin-5AC-like isoform X2 [Penaeus japonicus]|uniref:mucin-5AC-like isoform X2 n=1 Tax=Penaeus japonicus TaxID=27405 RepID=UPI001C70CF6F|nr:mucin-5AC-like isoform X2 [Penaeus japonicus]